MTDIGKILAIANMADERGQYDLADALDAIANMMVVGPIDIGNMKLASVKELIDFADHLDDDGQYIMASEIDYTLIKQADYTFIPQIRYQEKVEEKPIQSPSEGTLSTRYCPDHIGVQAARIAEGLFQCPIDGKKYNYVTGYENYHGQLVPGGSVAEQTPTSSDYGGIPMRIYDSRQTVLNTLN